MKKICLKFFLSLLPVGILAILPLVPSASSTETSAPPDFYRQLFSPPKEIVSAWFSPHVTEDSSSSRLAKYFKVKNKRVTRSEIYMELESASPMLDSLLARGARLKVWLRGSRKTPEGPWAIKMEAPLGQSASGRVWLRENERGSMLEFALLESSVGSTVSKGIIKAVLATGLVAATPSEAGKEVRK